MENQPTEEPKSSDPGPTRGLSPPDPSSHYLDFEVQIGPGQNQSYPLTVRSPAGEVREVFDFPLSPAQLESMLKSLEIALLRSGSGRRQVLSPEESAVQEFGQVLFKTLFSGDARSRYDRSLETARQHALGLRIKLDIQAPELARLPWEFLYDLRRSEFVCLSRETPVVRYIQLSQPIEALSVQPPLQILGMIANPLDLEQLDIQREKQRVEAAVRDLQINGLVRLTWLAGATWRDLQKAMRSGPWHIFHFIGHGGFDPQADEGLIALENEQKKANLLYATEMGRLLADHRTLRMALLNSCDGARGSAHDVFSSTASILVRRGLPAVLAMQYAITDRAAIEFSRALYEALADGLPVDASVAEARKAVSVAVNNTIEWGTPVLFMRAPQGIIFDLPAGKGLHAASAQAADTGNEPDTTTRRRQDERFTEGLAAFWVENWDKAIRSFQAIVEENPQHTEARARLDEAIRRKRWSMLYQQAQADCKAGHLPEALSALDELLALAPTYKDAAAMRQAVAQQRELEVLLGEARRLAAARQWQAVLNIFAQIDALDPAFIDIEQLRAAAQRGIAGEKRLAEASEQYAQAVRAVDSGEWQQAASLLKQVELALPDLPEGEPQFQECGVLLERVERELSQLRAQQRGEELEALYTQAARLLRGGQYEQVLVQWEKITAIDPAYVDRLQIRSTAARMLERARAEAAAAVPAGVEAPEPETAAVEAAGTPVAVPLTPEPGQEYATVFGPAPASGEPAAGTPDAPAKPARERLRLTLATGAGIVSCAVMAALFFFAYLPFNAAATSATATAFASSTLAAEGIIETQRAIAAEPPNDATQTAEAGIPQTAIEIDTKATLDALKHVRCRQAPNSERLQISVPWAAEAPVLDGEITEPHEWEDGVCLSITLYDYGSKPEDSRESQWWFLNDGEFIYLLAKVPSANWPAADKQGLAVSNWHTDWMDFWVFNLTDRTVTDNYTFTEQGFLPDEEASPPGQNNAEGYITTNGPFYWFEGRKSLASYDNLDWKWAPGDTVGGGNTTLTISIWIHDGTKFHTFDRKVEMALSSPP